MAMSKKVENDGVRDDGGLAGRQRQTHILPGSVPRETPPHVIIPILRRLHFIMQLLTQSY